MTVSSICRQQQILSDGQGSENVVRLGNIGNMKTRHFIGAEATTGFLKPMLKRLCRDLPMAEGDSSDLSDDVSELAETWAFRLRRTADLRRVVIVLDGLDQLDGADSAYELHWLPAELPHSVRILAASREHPILCRIRVRGSSVESRCGAVV